MPSLKKLPVMPLIECLANNDVVALARIEREMNVSVAMDSVSIRVLHRHIGVNNILKAISYLTLRLAENFNMRGNFNDTQAAVLANDLFDVFGYETLEDVVMMYKLARQGKIGDGKDFKLDGQTVLHKWVPAYLELKSIERENQHQRRKDSQKPANLPLSPKILQNAGKEKVQSQKGGIGSRKKEELKTENRSPIQRRDVYLNLLAEKIRNVKTSDLEIALQALEKDPNEKDSVQIVKKEIESRKRNTA